MSSGEKPLVQLIGIGKRYGTGPTAFDALHHVDLSINAGEFVAIMGPRGCTAEMRTERRSTDRKPPNMWQPRRPASSLHR